MAVPSPADCDGSHFVILLEEILIHSAVFWNTTMDQDMFELFPKVNFDQNLQRNLVKKEMKIATSHQKLHAGTFYIHTYVHCTQIFKQKNGTLQDLSMSFIVGMKMPKLYVIRSGHSLGNDKK